MRDSCLVCQKPIAPFMSFGKQPIANGFLRPEDVAGEYFYELAVASCEGCGAFQLLEQPEAEQMFNESYAFFSGTSRHMARHFQAFAEDVLDGVLAGRPDPFVVEIGSNDGILVKNVAARGVRHLGVEPSKNVADVARAAGVNTLSAFFNAETAVRIVAEYGQADAYLAANCMCHIPTLHSVVEGIDVLLKPDGVVVFEDPYLGDMIEKTSYDQIYDEHSFIFSVQAIASIFARHGMELFHVEPQKTHGGSMRYFLARKGVRAKSAALTAQEQAERRMGLDKPETYQAFRERCERSKADLVRLLERLKGEGKRVMGYAATSKSTTILNYAGVGPELIEAISDTTPIKQGKVSPGVHVPVVPHETFAARYPDYAFLFAWNHFEEVMAKETGFAAAGGRWITHVPEVRVLGP